MGPAIGQRAHLFARAEIAREMLHIGKPQRLRDPRHRQFGFDEQFHDLIRPDAADVFVNGTAKFLAKFYFQLLISVNKFLLPVKKHPVRVI